MSSFSRGPKVRGGHPPHTRAWNTALGALVGVVFGACVAAAVLAVLGARAWATLPCEGRAAAAALGAAPSQPSAVARRASAAHAAHTAHLLHTVTEAVRRSSDDAVVRLATWCPFACVLVAVDTTAQRQAVFATLTTVMFQRAGNAPFTARLTGVPYDNLVYVVLKKPSPPAAAADDDDPTPALPVAEVLTPARARALQALDAVFGGTHYVTPKRKAV